MPEEILFEMETRLSRGEIAAILRDTADKLDGDGELTLSAGGDSITLDPPANPTFEVKAERETSTGAEHGELSIEFELEWDERESGADATDSTLSIE
jgi:amphi-Trp domain-containing protein